MRYKKHILFLIFLNLIIVFLSIFTGNLTRKLEVSNNELHKLINKEKNQLNINSLELTFYNNPTYLKKLHNIYFSNQNTEINNKIISFSNFAQKDKKKFVLINVTKKNNER